METSTSHFKITYQGKIYNTKEELVADLGENPIDYEHVVEVTLSGNSYGREACDYLASLLANPTPLLTTVNFNDMFVGRKLDELPGSLEVLVRALMGKNIVHLNLSDNAFGPAGIKAFDFLLKEMKTLKTLKVTNCGLGPEGGEMIAQALQENKDMKLVRFSAGRDRLENKGITALAAVFKEMGSLEAIEIPQNGIKKDGMVAFLGALKESAECLKELYVHDNWIKGQATDKLVEFVVRARKLERLNISDSTMGTKSAYLLVKALADSSIVKGSLKQFLCNYNEIESSVISKKILDLLLTEFPNLEYVEFKGNALAKKDKKDYILRFQESNKKIVFYDEDEEDDEEDDEPEEEEDDNSVDEDDIIQKLEQLKL